MTKKTLAAPSKRAKKEASPPGEAARYYYKGNRLKQMRAFVATVKLGTLSRAAESLYLSQPSISLQLHLLVRYRVANMR